MKKEYRNKVFRPDISSEDPENPGKSGDDDDSSEEPSEKAAAEYGLDDNRKEERNFFPLEQNPDRY